MRVAFVGLLLLLRVLPAFGADKKETPHLEFFSEYVHELFTNEETRASADREQKAGTKDEALTNGIHASTLIQLDLRSEIAVLKEMRLNPPYDTIIPTLIEAYQQKIVLHQRMIEIATTFMEGPKPGVNYGKLSAEMPQVRAKMEFIDETIFKMTPLVFATLIDQKPDSHNHLSHLITTKSQRQKLIDDLNTDFGTKLDQKEQNATVSAATVLRGYLLKDFGNSDDPWE